MAESNKIAMSQNDWKSLLFQKKTLYVVGVNENGHPGRVYEVESRSSGRLECFLFGELEEATFQHRGCGCGSEREAKGDYLVLVGRVTSAGLGGMAQTYDLITDTVSGEKHELYLFFPIQPTEKVRETITK